jgi:hypothetical protein
MILTRMELHKIIRDWRIGPIPKGSSDSDKKKKPP